MERPLTRQCRDRISDTVWTKRGYKNGRKITMKIQTLVFAVERGQVGR